MTVVGYRFIESDLYRLTRFILTQIFFVYQNVAVDVSSLLYGNFRRMVNDAYVVVLREIDVWHVGIAYQLVIVVICGAGWLFLIRLYELCQSTEIHRFARLQSVQSALCKSRIELIEFDSEKSGHGCSRRCIGRSFIILLDIEYGYVICTEICFGIPTRGRLFVHLPTDSSVSLVAGCTLGACRLEKELVDSGLFTKEALDISLSRVEKALNLILNVDYRTIDPEAWGKELAENQRGGSSAQSYMNALYAESAIENRLHIEGTAKVEPSMIYDNGPGWYVRAKVKFIIHNYDKTADRILYNYTFKHKLETGVWYEGYADIHFSSVTYGPSSTKEAGIFVGASLFEWAMYNGTRYHIPHLHSGWIID